MTNRIIHYVKGSFVERDAPIWLSPLVSPTVVGPPTNYGHALAGCGFEQMAIFGWDDTPDYIDKEDIGLYEDNQLGDLRIVLHQKNAKPRVYFAEMRTGTGLIGVLIDSDIDLLLFRKEYCVNAQRIALDRERTRAMTAIAKSIVADGALLADDGGIEGFSP